jgi:starch phosphorylase
MWAHVWPERPEDEIPITHVTNGVHIPSWISIENSLLFERHLGPDWHLQFDNPEFIDRIDDIYDEELWRAHEMSRSRLIRTCRKLMLKQYNRRNAPKTMIELAETALDPEILTIGFARRFATYKRGNLLLHDPERLEALITDAKRPVQFIFAGKAHPKDNDGKEMIKRLIEFCRRSPIHHRVVFIEDYGINLARHLYQGADVWLNTPRRPFEACGTSGMKAAVNGVLNLSILDGWWVEGYNEDRGWRIGNGEEYTDHAYQDAIESQALYNILEYDVISVFYDRKNGGVPIRWLQMMKASIKMALQEFSSHLMVTKYATQFYGEAARHYDTLLQKNAQAAKEILQQHDRLKTLWKNIQVGEPSRDREGPFRIGDTVQMSCEVNLGEIKPEEVEVQLYYGNLKSGDHLIAGQTQLMRVLQNRDNGQYLYGCDLTCEASGRFGFTVRVTPAGDERLKTTPQLLTWA